jgi:hypothetical protein
MLHVGAHRTGTTTLQRVMCANRRRLLRQGIAFLGPEALRGARPGQGGPAAGGAAGPHAVAAAADGLLIVSEENLLGTMPACLGGATLYPGAGARLAAAVAAFGPGCRGIGLAIRRPDDWWASVIAHQAAQGRAVSLAQIAALSAGRRGWRDVIAELAAACPGVAVVVWRFDALIGDPAAQLGLLAGRPVRLPPRARARHENRSLSATGMRARLLALGAQGAAALVPPGDTRWMPFNAAQRQVMQASWAADLAWLRAGADGCARFVESAHGPAQPGERRDDGEQGRLGATG